MSPRLNYLLKTNWFVSGGIILVLGLLLPFPNNLTAQETSGEPSQQLLQKLDTLVVDTTKVIPSFVGKKSSEPRDFFKTPYSADDPAFQQRVDQIQLEMEQIKIRLEKVENETSINRMRREIKRLTQGEDEISEITMQNGTVVMGNIIAENMDRIIVQTQIGQLTLDRTTIRGVKAQQKPHAVLALDGNYEERNYPDKRAFTGQVINKGLRRGDFVRVVFRLHDSKTNIIAQDSTFLAGETTTYLSGVVGESALSPNKTSKFYLEVPLPSGVDSRNISYVTYKVRFDEFD